MQKCIDVNRAMVPDTSRYPKEERQGMNSL